MKRSWPLILLGFLLFPGLALGQVKGLVDSLKSGNGQAALDLVKIAFSAPERYAGIASGVNSTVSRLGSLMAVAVIGLVITLVFEANTDVQAAVPLAMDQTAPQLRQASIDGFRAGMAVAAALAFAGAAVGAFGISNREARGETPPPVTEQAPAPAGS